MSIPMVIAMKTGIAPMPAPIPLEIAKTILGDVAKPLLMAVAILSHFGYGAFWAALAAKVRWPFGIKEGLGLGVGLWALMQIAVLPLIGWGVLGLEITGFPPKIALATLVLHLIYGLVVGSGLARSSN